MAPGSAFVAPPGSVSSLTPYASSSVAQPLAVDTKLIDDHLAVQAIVRAYQVRSSLHSVISTCLFGGFSLAFV